MALGFTKLIRRWDNRCLEEVAEFGEDDQAKCAIPAHQWTGIAPFLLFC